MNNYKTKTEYEHTLESAIAAVGAAIADISRVKILCALMDGRAWTATELSIAADISASTTSLLNHAQTQGWIKRHQGYREVTINEKGNKAFAQYFNITITD